MRRNAGQALEIQSIRHIDARTPDDGHRLARTSETHSIQPINRRKVGGSNVVIPAERRHVWLVNV